MSVPFADDHGVDVIVRLSNIGGDLYRAGYAAGYAKAKAEQNELKALNELASATAPKPQPDATRASEPVEDEHVDDSASRAPYGAVRQVIMKVLRAVEMPMKPVAIHSRLLEEGYSFVKEATIRSTLHKLRKDGFVKNIGDGWIATGLGSERHVSTDFKE